MEAKSQSYKLGLLRSYSSALVTDALRRLDASNAWPRNLHAVSAAQGKVVGRVVTLRYALASHGVTKKARGQLDIIEECKPGDILVYAALGVDAWLLGDNVANFAIRKKIGGIIVDGAVRDVDDLAKCSLPIFCKGRSARPYAEELILESVNADCEVGGALVRPDDIIIGDSDGIAVIPHAKFDDVLLQLEDLAAIDASASRAIAAGVDITTINKILSRKAHVKT